MEINSEKQHRKLRIANWIFSILCFFGILTFMFKATGVGIIFSFLFLLLTIISYTVPAILLYSGVNIIFGIPIFINSKLIYKLSLGANILFLLLGICIILITFYQEQYGAGLSGFLYLFLSYFNIRALNFRVKELG